MTLNLELLAASLGIGLPLVVSVWGYVLWEERRQRRRRAREHAARPAAAKG
ncbi:hypothetical protein [Paracraurococcus lichenis]|uniref:Heme exporter protein D n=1 Tax=Paracraurococcus lichenis TaxID=3064888 RepID=A0ABT9DXM7_9PROT|nr:hypothetical protein [Paracraurococcus sp. LOR1-02]MDO9708634.1 hypothetical protein [Paracraurococcus sp. LOR1-02]